MPDLVGDSHPGNPSPSTTVSCIAGTGPMQIGLSPLALALLVTPTKFSSRWPHLFGIYATSYGVNIGVGLLVCRSDITTLSTLTLGPAGAPYVYADCWLSKL
jgi:hypothetical protein